MQLIILVALLALVVSWVRWPLFETVFAVILLTPILFLSVAAEESCYPLVYWASMITLVLVVTLLVRVMRFGQCNRNREEFVPLVFFALAFIAFSMLCQQWPDFIAIGERLRDYALLSSVIESPISLKEPWLAGYPLNYYAYWYRVGHMFAVLFHWPTWEVYHYLQSFCYALFASAQLRIFRSYLKFSWIGAFVCTILITLGSNWAGVVHVLSAGENWWGPSRVIAGAINEFPVWSFILGDLHPHYLNLPLIPFFFSVVFCVFSQRIRPGWACFFILLFVVPALWLRSANAWDVPIWLLYAAVFVMLHLLISWRNNFSGFSFKKFELKDLGSPVLLVFLLLFSWFLWLSSNNLQSVEYPLTFVTSKVGRTSLVELGRHWALPLSLIGLALIRLAPSNYCRVATIVLLPLLLITGQAWPFLLSVFLLNLVRLWFQLFRVDQASATVSSTTLALEAVGIISLALLIGPEFFFLDDPYGGENERMNTIFKVYSANWFLLHTFSFYLISRAWSTFPGFPFKLYLARLLQVSAAAFFTLFLMKTVPQRANADFHFAPANRGLSSLDRQFPGAALAIVELSRLPRGVVIEAQGPPYSYTSHVATLSGNYSYLGWRNHVDLLVRSYGESQRREQISNEAYTIADCPKRRDLLEREGVSYLVVGPLEKKRYGVLPPEMFACLESVIVSGQYSIFGLGSR